MLIHFIPAFETKWVQHNFETKFKRLCSQCAKYLIPKEVYYKTIDNLKTADAVSTHKSRHQYYILKMYEVLQFGDVEKLIKKRSHQKITQSTMSP